MSEKRGQKLKIVLAAIIFSGTFLFLLTAKNAQAVRSTSTYDKPASGTLGASEWNGLFGPTATPGILGSNGDFVNTWLPSAMNGPLGIATSAPMSGGIMLDVNGIVRATSFIGAMSSTIGAQNVSGGVFGVNAGGGNYVFPGNLGLGTTTMGMLVPNGWADSMDSKFIGVRSDTLNYDSGLFLRRAAGGNDTGLDVWADNSTGQAYIDTRYNDPAGSLFFRTKTAGTPVNALTILGGGNVGIGITNPNAKLDLAGIFNVSAAQNGATALATINNTNGSTSVDSYGLKVTGGNSIYIGAAIPTSYAGYFQGGNTNSLPASSWGIYVAPGTGAGNNYAAYFGGKVGIGTTSPTENLQIKGNAKILSELAGTGAAYFLGRTATEGTLAVSGGADQYAVGSVAGDIILRTEATSQKLILNSGIGTSTLVVSNGNVGVGTTNPQYKLDVRSTSFASYFDQPVFVGSPTASGHAATKAYVDSVLVPGNGTSTVGYWTANGTHIYNANSANVGIGTTAPNEKLNVSGNISVNSGATFRLYNAAGTGWAEMAYNEAANLISFQRGLTSSGNDFKLAVSGQNSYINANSGNVGIGITNPAAKLDIFSSTTAGSNLKIQTVVTGAEPSATVDFWLQNLSTGGSTAKIEAKQTDYQNNALIFSTETGNTMAERIRIHTNGNVGIGTTNPLYKLDVSGTGSFTQPVIVGTPTAASHATTKSYVDSLITPGAGTSTVGYWTANGNHIYNANSANVGIGVTNPLQKLDVNGSVQSTGNFISSAGDVYLKSSSGTNTVFRGVRATTAWSDAVDTQWFQIGNSSDNVAFTALSGTPAARMAFITSALHITTSAGTAAPVGLFDISNGSTKLFNVLSAGNVGIGTTNPLYKLDVSGTGSFTQPVIVGTPTAASHATTKSYVDSLITPGAGTSTVGYWTANGNHIYNANSANVGIGTTNPGGILTVSKSDVSTGMSVTRSSVLRMANPNTGSANTFTGLSFGFNTGNPNGQIIGMIGGQLTDLTSNWGGALVFGTKANSSATDVTEYMRIAMGGNVGIGTTNPIYNLHIYSSVGDGRILNNNSTAGSTASDGSYWRQNGVNTIFGNQEAGDMQLFVDNTGTNGIYIKSGGNVGIGTTNPLYKLDVSGTGSFTQPVIVGTPTAASHATTKSYVDSLITPGAGTSTVGYWTANGNHIYNANSANVGIGVTNPAARLSIRGAVSSDILNILNSSGTQVLRVDDSGNITTNSLIVGQDNVSGNGLGLTTDSDQIIISVDDYDQYNIASGRITIDGQNDLVSLHDALQITNTNAGNSTIPLKLTNASDSSNSAASLDFNVGAGSGFVSSRIKSTRTNSGASGVSNLSLLINDGYGLLELMTFKGDTSRVGIGTTNPLYKLDVSGTGSFTQPVIVGTPTAASHATTKSYVDSLITPGAGTSTVGYWTANGNHIYNANSANVGIGVTNPGSNLVVSSNDNSIIDIRSDADNNSASRYSILQFSNNLGTTKGVLAYNEDIDAMELSYGGTNQNHLIVKNGGNVGIGTTNPAIDLDVSKANSGGRVGINIYNTADAVNTYSSLKLTTPYSGGAGSVTGEIKVDDALLMTISNDSGKIALMPSSNVGIGTTNPLYKLDVSGTGSFTQPVIVGTPTAASHATTKSYVDSLITPGAGTSTVGYWTANGNHIYNANSANVGIGITNPMMKLHVNGDMAFGTSNNATINQGMSGNQNYFTFSTDGVEKIRIANGGNVGIGTTAPGGKLHISDTSGTAGIANSLVLDQTKTLANGDGNAIIFSENSDYSSAPAAKIYNYVTDYSDHTSQLRFATRYSNGGYGPWDTMTLSNGRVGIGTTNPLYKLDVSGTGSFTQPVIVGTPTAASHATTKSYVDSLITPGAGTSTVGYWTANGNHIYNANSANVGIGTTTPVAKLEVYSGNLKINGGNLYLADTTGQNSTYLQSYGGGGSLWMIQPGAMQSFVIADAVSWDRSMSFNYTPGTTGAGAGRLTIGQTSKNGATFTHGITSLYTNGLERMRLDASGNVGIGTTNPKTKLQISGDNTGVTGRGTFSLVKNEEDYGLFAGVSGNGDTWMQTRIGGSATYYNLLLNAQGGNVGIGTTNPQYKLDVSGTGSFTQPVIVGTPTASGHATTKSYVDSLLTPGAGTSTVGYWTANGNHIYNANSANVGIGTTVPIANLEVKGAVSPQLVVNSSGTYPASPQIDLYRGGTKLMSIRSDAYPNVFIGIDAGLNNSYGPTTGKNQTFIGYNAGYSSMFGVDNTAIGYQALYSSGPSMVTGNTAIGSLAGYNSNDNGYNTFLGYRSGYSVTSASSNTFIGSNAGDNASQKVDAGNSTALGYGAYTTADNQVVIGNSSVTQTLLRGNVGIGTTAPGYRLDAYAPNTFDAYYRFQRQDTTRAVGLTLGNATVNRWSMYMPAATDDLRFALGATDYVTIKTDGNLGIGTTAPAGPLNVAKAAGDNLIYADNYSTTGGNSNYWFSRRSHSNTNGTLATTLTGDAIGTFFFQGVNTSNAFAYGAKIIAQQNGSAGTYIPTDLNFSTYSATAQNSNQLVLSNNGNVGIGTTTPGATLDVNGSIRATSFVGNVTSNIAASNVSAGEFGVSTSGGNFSFGTTVSGNVGVGVNVPVNKFSVSYDTAAYSPTAYNLATMSLLSPNTNGDFSGIRFSNSNNQREAFFGVTQTAATTGDFVFQGYNGASYNEYLRITSSGNVGIGTTAPGNYKLKVAGDVAITGTLSTQTGSDFAEEFSTSEPLEAGTVVVMSNQGYKSVKPCEDSYDKKVVGIVSDNPSIIAGRVESANKAIVAMMGVVKVKACDLNGPISKGDLLTTSNIKGYAMKAKTEKSGTIIGKALEDLTGEQGEIKVLVNLQ